MTAQFADELKWADIVPIHKKVVQLISLTIDPSPFFRLFPKSDLTAVCV